MSEHVITLMPVAKGWELHVFHAPTGARTLLPATNADEAKAAATDALGFQPEWVELEAKYPNWPQSFKATNPEGHTK